MKKSKRIQRFRFEEAADLWLTPAQTINLFSEFGLTVFRQTLLRLAKKDEIHRNKVSQGKSGLYEYRTIMRYVNKLYSAPLVKLLYTHWNKDISKAVNAYVKKKNLDKKGNWHRCFHTPKKVFRGICDPEDFMRLAPTPELFAELEELLTDLFPVKVATKFSSILSSGKQKVKDFLQSKISTIATDLQDMEKIYLRLLEAAFFDEDLEYILENECKRLYYKHTEPKSRKEYYELVDGEIERSTADLAIDFQGYNKHEASVLIGQLFKILTPEEKFIYSACAEGESFHAITKHFDLGIKSPHTIKRIFESATAKITRLLTGRPQNAHLL